MEAAVSRVATDLAPVGARVMSLKGPAVQRRLLGTPAAYPSDDVDVLVDGLSPTRTIAALRSTGWDFSPLNGRLWRLDGAAAVVGHGVFLDVHWGLHVGLVPARRMRPLLEELWATSRRTEGGWYEPAITPLAAYLCLHGANRFETVGKRSLATAAITSSGDWPAILELAARCGMELVAESMRVALESSTPPPDVLTLTYGPRAAKLMRLVRSQLPRRLRRWTGGSPPL